MDTQHGLTGAPFMALQNLVKQPLLYSHTLTIMILLKECEYGLMKVTMEPFFLTLFLAKKNPGKLMLKKAQNLNTELF